MRQRFDRLLIAMGIAMFCLTRLAGLGHLSKGSTVANQLGAGLSLVVLLIGLVDQWHVRRTQRRGK